MPIHTHSTKLSSPKGWLASTGLRPVISSRSTTPNENTSDLSVSFPLDAYSGAKYLKTIMNISKRWWLNHYYSPVYCNPSWQKACSLAYHIQFRQKGDQNALNFFLICFRIRWWIGWQKSHRFSLFPWNIYNWKFHFTTLIHIPA